VPGLARPPGRAAAGSGTTPCRRWAAPGQPGFTGRRCAGPRSRVVAGRPGRRIRACVLRRPRGAEDSRPQPL